MIYLVDNYFFQIVYPEKIFINLKQIILIEIYIIFMAWTVILFIFIFPDTILKILFSVIIQVDIEIIFYNNIFIEIVSGYIQIRNILYFSISVY